MCVLFCGVKITIYIKMQGGFKLHLTEKFENKSDIMND